jgi:hypothetical protein
MNALDEIKRGSEEILLEGELTERLDAGRSLRNRLQHVERGLCDFRALAARGGTHGALGAVGIRAGKAR